MMLKAVIFDVDGVLVDSKNANVAFFQALFSKAGYKDISTEDIQACFHLPLWQSLEKLVGSDDQHEIKRIFEMAYDPSLRGRELLEFPEKLEVLLEELHRKYKLGIVTSRIKVGVDDIFKVKEIRHLFDAVVTFEDYANPKPHPEPLQVALQRLDVAPSEAVYIGDSPSDIDAAKAAGMRSVFLSSSDHEHATAKVAAFYQLTEAIEKLGSSPPAWPGKRV